LLQAGDTPVHPAASLLPAHDTAGPCAYNDIRGAEMAVERFERVVRRPDVAYNIEDQERMSRAKNYFAWQSRLVLRELGQRVVEIGCGLGNFTGMLLDREIVIAVDSEPACIQRLQERYPNQKNLRAFVCDVSRSELSHLAQFQPDSCVCLNTLEHIEDDRGALASMASILTPGGVITLLVPAFPALHGPIDANLGHYRRYSVEAVTSLAKSANLRIKQMRYMNAIGFLGWWANARVFRREAQSAAQIEVFDRWVVPWMSRIEDWIKPPFGQSLFVVVEK
jgi:SAM-dependent methyltransferase